MILTPFSKKCWYLHGITKNPDQTDIESNLDFCINALVEMGPCYEDISINRYRCYTQQRHSYTSIPKSTFIK